MNKSQLKVGQVLYHSNKHMYKAHQLVTSVWYHGYNSIISSLLSPNYFTSEDLARVDNVIRGDGIHEGFDSMKSCLIVPDQFLGPVGRDFNPQNAPLLYGIAGEDNSMIRSRAEEYRNQIKQTEYFPNPGLKVGAIYFDPERCSFSLVTHFTDELIYFQEGIKLSPSHFAGSDFWRRNVRRDGITNWIRVPDALLAVIGKEEGRTINLSRLTQEDKDKFTQEFLAKIRAEALR
jgi:hypothetical protein